MTQEELDAMMSDPEGMDSIDKNNKKEEDTSLDKVEKDLDLAPELYEENKVVKQLEQVTKESEVKAVELFDKLSNINEEMDDSTVIIKLMNEKLDDFDKLFQVLNTKFPNIHTFKDAHEKMFSFRRGLEQIQKNIDNTNDDAFDAMDKMQFQDIHRQKIERVINVMRKLSRYMNALFVGKIDDKNRSSSATHISGDKTTEDVINNDDIETLLTEFSKNHE